MMGVPIPVLDAEEKVTGRLVYLADMKIPRPLTAKVLFSPYPHANIKSINIEKAEQLPGVHTVLCHTNTPATRFSNNTERVFDSRVRYCGDRVAVVAAETEEIAKNALQLIEVEYEELPFYLSGDSALKGTVPLHGDSNVAGTLEAETGQMDEAIRQAQHCIRETYSVPLVHHGALETHGAVAGYGEDGILTIWTTNYALAECQQLLSNILNLPCNKIRVKSCPLGGSFGGKVKLVLEPVVALLAIKTKRNIRLIYNRMETMASTGSRHGAKIVLTTTIGPNGKISGLEADIQILSGAYGSQSQSMLNAMKRPLFQNYRIPNIRYRAVAIYTNTVPGFPMRGFGDPQITFALETQMERTAVLLQKDPVTLRQEYVCHPYEKDLSTGYSLGNIQLEACLNKGIEAFQWFEKRKEAEKSQWGDLAYGVGLALCNHGNGLAPFVTDINAAFIQMFQDGSVAISTGAGNQGGGSYTAFAQIAATVLQISHDKVSIVSKDTLATPYDFGAISSRNTFVSGKAVEKAALEIKNQCLQSAAAYFQTSLENVILQEGKFVHRLTGRDIAYKELLLYAFLKEKKVFVAGVSHASPHNAGSTGAHFTRVEVNKQTGQVKVLEYLAVCDIGKAINPLLLTGQIEGAVQMGMGYALQEALTYHTQTGQLTTANFRQYKMVKACQMPPIRCLFIESPEPGGPFGAKGIGEASVVAVAPAITNAIYHALGTPIAKLPAVPEAVLSLIGTTP